MFFHRRTFLVAILRKLCHVLLINFLTIMEKAVCILGSIALQDKKIKINSQALEGKPSKPKVCLFGRNSLPT